MSRFVAVVALAAGALAVGCNGGGGCSGSPSGDGEGGAASRGGEGGLAAPSEFDAIEDERRRARALFEEMGEVLTHPRCVNCHPAGDQPLAGDQSRPHQPLVERGPGGMGHPGMRCTSCHGNENFRNVPGRPGWRLAPAEMAWVGKSLPEICEQIKDPERNGGMSLEELVEHLAEDPLVAYGWGPPDQYETAPGTHDRFGALAEAWVEAGAACPERESSD